MGIKMEKRISLLFAEGQIKEAIEMLEQEVKLQESEEKLLLLGELYYKEGRSVDALNKFNAVLKINPVNKKAAAYVTMINDVLDFYHKDLLNP